jgi:hypothetical protein
LEREQQQAEAGPALDRRGLDKARKQARQAVILAAEVVVSGVEDLWWWRMERPAASEVVSAC